MILNVPYKSVSFQFYNGWRICIPLPSCHTLPIEGEWLLHPSQSFCPASHPVLLCKDCPVFLVTSGSQQPGTASHRSQPPAMPQATLPWCKACSVSPVHSVKRETAELGLPWKGYSCIQCADFMMQNFVVQSETHVSSCSSGCPLCGLEHCYPVFLPSFSMMTYWFSRQIFPLRERELPKAHVPVFQIRVLMWVSAEKKAFHIHEPRDHILHNV